MSMSKTRRTRYGPVDAEALEALQQSFDTYRLLEAVDTIDRLRARICEPDAMRHELLTLHGMAYALINGDDPSGATAPEPIWEVAEDLASELSDFIDGLGVALGTLEELTELAPDPDDEADGDTAAEEE
jgi:hypothetical protein